MTIGNVALLGLLVALASCSETASPAFESIDETMATKSPEAPEAPEAPETQAANGALPIPLSAPNPLRDEDLSDERVAGMELEDLWQLGVDALEWPAERPLGSTKSAVHQRLLDEKYRGAGLPLDD